MLHIGKCWSINYRGGGEIENVFTKYGGAIEHAYHSMSLQDDSIDGATMALCTVLWPCSQT